jgi:hypothetical protein
MTDYGTTDRFTGGSITASSYYSTYVAANAVDDNASTKWHPNTLPDSWLKYDFGAAVKWKISKVTTKSLNVGASVKNFTVNGSNNDSDYSLLYTGLAADNTNVQTFTFINKTEYRYIKIIFLDGYGAALEVAEIQSFEGIYPVDGILSWFFNSCWAKHDKLWRNNKLYLPKDLSFQI